MRLDATITTSTMTSTGTAAVLAILLATSAGARNVQVIGRLDEHAGYSSVWGYETPAGDDLAIIATDDGTAFIDVSDPALPVEVGFIPGTAGARRTVRTFRSWAYVVCADGGGLQIVSLASPSSPTLAATYTDAFTTAAGLTVDEGDTTLFVTGTENGLVALDLSNPVAPTVLATHDTFTSADLVVRSELAYVAAEDAMAVLDVSEQSGIPVLRLFAWVAYPGPAATGVALAPSPFCLVTDADGGLRVFDVSVLAPSRIAEVGAYTHPDDPLAGTGQIATDGETAFVAWHAAGLEVLDLSDPTHPERIASFDSFAGAGPGDQGAVGVYPFASSGYVYLSDSDGGLHVLEVTPEIGAIEGILTDTALSGPASQILVTVPALGKRTLSSGQGAYRLRLPAGTYDIVFERFRFVPTTAQVTVNPGATTVLDLDLDRLPSATITGTITLGGGRGTDVARHPEGDRIRLVGEPLDTNAFLGTFTLPIPAGRHIVEFNRFGYSPRQFEITLTPGELRTLNVTLDQALIAETFESESGWTAGAGGDDAVTGIWERVQPIGTGAGYVQPERDETPDPALTAFVTGNGPPGGWIEEADVDGGRTTLVSPVYDLSGVVTPLVRYYRWFSNGATWGGETPDGDRLEIDVSTDGGQSWTNLETLTEPWLFWRQVDYVLEDVIIPTSAVQFRFVVHDDGAPSIVEAAIDDFTIFSGTDMLILPPDETPIDLGSVEVVSTGPGRVTLRWLAPGGYHRFVIERSGSDGRTLSVGELPGGADGDRYVFTDVTAPAGATVRYWIVGYTPRGAERVGPYAVRVRSGSSESAVLAAAPNPMTSRAAVVYRVGTGEAGAADASRAVELVVFDVQGRAVATLVRELLPPGVHRAGWDGTDATGRNVPSGVYFYRLSVGDETLAGKLLLAR